MQKKEISDYVAAERYTKTVYALNKGSTRIGRNDIGNNIKIKHPSCSNYHATIMIRANLILFHDFSNNGTNVLKRIKFRELKNETTRIYENSRIQIANREFTIHKLKNCKTNIIEINDDSDIEETVQENKFNQTSETKKGVTHTKNNENKAIYEKTESSDSNFINSDSEIEENNEINFNDDENDFDPFELYNKK